MINPQWLELPMSRTNFYGPNDVRAIKVRLYVGALHNSGLSLMSPYLTQLCLTSHTLPKHAYSNIRGCIKKYVDFYYNFKTTQRKSIKFCTRIKQ